MQIKLISKKYGANLWTAFKWLRIGSSGGLLWTRSGFQAVGHTCALGDGTHVAQSSRPIPLPAALRDLTGMKSKGQGAMTCEAYNALGHFRV